MSSLEHISPASSSQFLPELESAVKPIAALELEAQQQAFLELPTYEVNVLRRTTHKDLGETPYARFTQEVVRFDDGAVRLLTRTAPKERYFSNSGVIPYAISGGDALFTGPDGMNAEFIDSYAKIGYPVIWLHHQGRHAPFPTNRERVKTMAHFLSSKSVGKSAHHDHAVIDDLESKEAVDFNTAVLLRDGFSRSSMSGEAFIAMAPNFDRTVPHSDLTAKCFALHIGFASLVELAVVQGPEEAKGFFRVVQNIVRRELAGEKGILRKYAGTFDLHILNIMHEMAWIPPLISGDSGTYSKAIPIQTSGVRGFLSKDSMSQYEEHAVIHADHPNLVLLLEDGAHVDGAIIEKKIVRWERVATYMRRNGMSLQGMKPSDYLPKDSDYELAA
ncbi:MAG: hypothetical protein QG628_37 [Patescibacteria group bacterium]|nr:hypothetical protein [Patescibacteria group bacterium]